jgi:hypothetical protein
MWDPSSAPQPGPFRPAPGTGSAGSKTKLAVAAIAALMIAGVALAAAVAFVLTRPMRQAASLEQAKDLPRKADVPCGVLVTEVSPSSVAERCGLRVGDVIVLLDGAPVFDQRTYAAAMDAASATGRSEVEIRISRGPESSVLKIPPGKLGFVYEPWTLLKDRITTLLRTRQTDAAAQSIARAERDGLLSPTQLLVVKIQAIGDSAGADDAARREALVDRLLHSVDPCDYGAVAFAEFDHPGSLNAAVALYTPALAREPDDVSTRLNLGNSLSLLGRFDEAEETVMVEYARPKPNLSRHGYHVAESVLGTADQGRKRYRSAAEHLRKAIELEPAPDGWDLEVLYMHAAGRSGGLAAFARAEQYCRKVSGSSFDKWQCHADAIEAELLDEAGRRDEALQVVARWRSDAHVLSNVESYWAQPYVAGDDVLDAWHSLLRD